MFYKRKYFKPFFFLAILVSSITLVTYIYLIKEEQNLLDIKYKNLINHSNLFIKNLIEDKENTTLVLAIALSKDEKIKNLIQQNDLFEFDYENILKELKENTKYKNVWIQIKDENENILYRSWTNIKSTSENKTDKHLINEKISSSIQISNFDLEIQGRAPIIHLEKTIGFIEVITHFNSIIEQLKEENIDSLIIVDKKFKEKLTHPFSNKFLGDYYVSNKNFPKNLSNDVNEKNIEKFLTKNLYIIDKNYLINNYQLSSHNQNLGYIVNFTNLNNIDIDNIKNFKSQLITNIIILFIFLAFCFLIYIYIIESKNARISNTKLKKHIKQLKIQQQYKQSILDSQTSIIVITNGEIIINSNKRLFDFFNDVKNLTEFREKYICICSAFIDMNDEIYVIDKDYNGKNWALYILENKDKIFRVAMFNSDQVLRHFSINVSTIGINNNIIVTLTDITTEIEQIELNKEKDRLLHHQLKISAISDTLKNIAHHWRQPLSVISTIASGMKIEKELNVLSDERFNELCDNIVISTNKLSNTIENFSNIFNTDDTTINFELVESINEILKFLNSIFEKNNIQFVFAHDNNKILNCNKTDFSQAIINILDNSIYALIHKKELNERYLFIEFKNNILSIKDTADGIEEKILSKIFEPYFTTKHKSYGTGLGLYIVDEFFVKNLGYKIDVKNVTFEYKNRNYQGTNFIIYFN